MTRRECFSGLLTPLCTLPIIIAVPFLAELSFSPSQILQVRFHRIESIKQKKHVVAVRMCMNDWPQVTVFVCSRLQPPGSGGFPALLPFPGVPAFSPAASPAALSGIHNPTMQSALLQVQALVHVRSMNVLKTNRASVAFLSLCASRLTPRLRWRASLLSRTALATTQQARGTPSPCNQACTPSWAGSETDPRRAEKRTRIDLRTETNKLTTKQVRQDSSSVDMEHTWCGGFQSFCSQGDFHYKEQMMKKTEEKTPPTHTHTKHTNTQNGPLSSSWAAVNIVVLQVDCDWF